MSTRDSQRTYHWCRNWSEAKQYYFRMNCLQNYESESESKIRGEVAMWTWIWKLICPNQCQLWKEKANKYFGGINFTLMSVSTVNLTNFEATPPLPSTKKGRNCGNGPARTKRQKGAEKCQRGGLFGQKLYIGFSFVLLQGFFNSRARSVWLSDTAEISRGQDRGAKRTYTPPYPKFSWK